MSRNRVIALENFQQFTAINVLSDPGQIGGAVVIPNCIQVVLVWNVESGKLAHNVLYGSASGAFTATTAIANALLTSLSTGGAWTGLAAFLSAGSALTAVQLRDVRTANQPLIQSNNTGSLGTSASPALPAEVAAAVTLRTAFAGRAARGRLYVPGWATNALAATNVIAGAAVTALGTWSQQIPVAMSAQGMTFVLGLRARSAYTGSTGTAHPARAATSLPITNITVRDNHWDSQRRRGLK